MEVEHRIGRGVEIAGLHHAGRAAAAHQHDRVVLDVEVREVVRHRGADDMQFRARQQHAAEIEELYAKIEQWSAAGGGPMQHPLDALLVVAIHHAAHEFEHDVVQRLAGSDLADRIDQRAIADHKRHRREQVGLRGAGGDVVRIGRGDGTWLFHRERDAFGDQEARLVCHVAMAAEGEGEVRLQPGAHLAIVGERGAARLGGDLRGARGVGVADADHRDVRHCQQRVQVEGCVPV